MLQTTSLFQFLKSITLPGTADSIARQVVKVTLLHFCEKMGSVIAWFYGQKKGLC